MKRILIVGTGSIGERHLRCFKKSGRAEVGVCESDRTTRARVSETYEVEESFPSLESALGVRWDAAVIAVPAHLHVPLAWLLADKGNHLLIEKPLSTTRKGVEALIETIKKRKLIAGVAYVYRAHPGCRWLRDRIQSEELGKPVEFIVQSGQHFPYYRPAYREIYYARHSQGGGAIQDGVTHLLNLGEWLFGPIDRVAADSAHQVLEGVKVEDTVHVMARHGEIMASYVLNQHQYPNETSLTVVFEKGAARFELHRNRCLWADEPGGEWKEEQLPELDRDGWFQLQAGSFLDSLEGKRRVLCTIQEGFQTLNVVRTIMTALEKGESPLKLVE